METLSQGSGVAVAIAPAAPDLALVAQAVQIPVLAQHTDPHEAGARTGHLVPEALWAAGVRGSLVNHSERPLSIPEVQATVKRLRDLELIPVVCARDDAHARSIAEVTRPPYLAVEPPELIGGTVSVSRARPELISRAVTTVREVSPSTTVLCGAGIQDGADAHRARELGAQGILIASAVTKAKDPEAVLKDLLAGLGTSVAPPSP